MKKKPTNKLNEQEAQEKLHFFEDPQEGLLHDQDETFDEIVAEQGYGTVMTAGVSVEKGITVEMTVNVRFKGISESSIENFTRQFAKENGLEDKYEESMTKKSVSGGVRFMWGFLSLCANGSYQDGQKNTKHTVNQKSSQLEKKFYQKLSQKTQSDLSIQGKITAVGTSAIPRKAKVYAQMMQIKRNNKTIHTIVSGDNKVIDEKKNQCGGGGQKLNVFQDQKSSYELSMAPLKHTQYSIQNTLQERLGVVYWNSYSIADQVTVLVDGETTINNQIQPSVARPNIRVALNGAWVASGKHSENGTRLIIERKSANEISIRQT